MASYFNIAKLKSLLQNFYVLTNIRIAIFDENYIEVVSYPSNISSFCKIIRTDPVASENCRLCDKKACIQAKKNQQFQRYECHAGLTEVVTPIHLNNILIGYLIMGHISPFQNFDEGWAHILHCCKNYKVDQNALKTAFLDRKYISHDYINSASHIMNCVASYLCISHMATLKNDSLLMQLDQYIYTHLTDDLSVSKLCAYFDISRTKIYKIADENYGIGISEYIRILRLQKAKELLLQTNLPINIVANSVGISDYNYFTKIFKKYVGVTPKEFRKTQ